MTALSMIAADLVAIAVLTVVLYYPRHRRADLVAAFTVVNVGVLAVAVVLAGSNVGIGLGMGLFGVLSIIRLRSTEISHREIAYYFAALALGLISGLSQSFSVAAIGLMALIVAVVAVIDWPRLLPVEVSQQLILGEAYPDQTRLRAAVEQVLGVPVRSVTTIKLDLVNETTTVDVRYREPRGHDGAAPEVMAGTRAGHAAGSRPPLRAESAGRAAA